MSRPARFQFYKITFKRNGEGHFVAPELEELLFAAIESELGPGWDPDFSRAVLGVPGAKVVLEYLTVTRETLK